MSDVDDHEGRSVRDQLLDAALETASSHGLARLSVGDVARTAGLSRQTLYRYFNSKDALVAALVAAETTKLIDHVVAAAAPFEDPEAGLEAGLAAALRVVREHPLLDRLVRTEPETLLPLLTVGGGPVMGQVRDVVDGLLALRVEDLPEDRRRQLADVVARLLVSYAVSAPEDPPEAVAAFVARFLVRGVAPDALSGA
jgi:AcrR family transcriptional regulator